MRRRTTVTAIVLALGLVATGCTKDPAPAPSPSSTEVGTTIVWKDCKDKASDIAKESFSEIPAGVGFECGTVRVPEDWANPGNGETFDISVMRATKGSPDGKKSVLTNPGGPGGSGLKFLAASFAEEATTLLGDMNVVSFDPRGVGESEPVECISDADLDASFGYDPDPASQASFDGNVALARHIAEGCGTKLGDDLRLFSTEQAAHDMDAIRAAVGDEKLTYFGFSYGTLLGAVYAELFPTKVRAMVLDGAVDPKQGPIEASEGQALGFERALTNYTAWCTAQGSKCQIASDPKGQIAAAVESARSNPVKGANGRVATSGWVLWGVILAMYSSDSWKYVGLAIDNLKKGDPALIFALADTYAERDEQGQFSNEFDANNAVNCTDSNYPTIDEIRKLQSEWRAKYPTFGAPLATGLLVCSLWPAKKDPFPVGPATGAPPIVVIGSVGDPATPYESTKKLADMLGVGQVLTYEGEGHATGYRASSCVRRAVNNYLIDLKIPEKDLRCPAA